MYLIGALHSLYHTQLCNGKPYRAKRLASRACIPLIQLHNCVALLSINIMIVAPS